MHALAIAACLLLGACVLLLLLIGVLVWFVHDQMGDL
jgi:hypothetical protein